MFYVLIYVISCKLHQFIYINMHRESIIGRHILIGCLIFFFTSLESYSLTEKSGNISLKDSAAILNKGYPVIFSGDTLFLIFNKLGSFTAQERAEAISKRIDKIAKEIGFSADSVKILSDENSYNIVYGETIIVSIFQKDANMTGLGTLELAKKYKTEISKSIKQYRKSTGLKIILLDIGIIIVVLIIVYLIIKYFNKLFRYTKTKIIRWKGKYFNGITIKNYELLTAKTQVKAILFINNILHWTLVILLIYLTLPLIFNILPWTKGIADTLFGFVLNPLKKIFLGFWNYLPNLFTIIVVLVVFRYVLKGLAFLKREIEREALKIPGFYPDWANPTYQIIRVLMFAFILVIIFPYLPGSDSPVFKGVSVFLGFLLTFGSAGSLSNVIAGLVLTYMRSFKIGDRVKIGDVTGDIIEKSLLVTRIRTIKNEVITLPNSIIMNSHSINYSSSSQNIGLILHTTVTIGYDAPWRKVHELLNDAAAATDLILKEPAPFVLQTSLDDFFVSYQLNAYTSEPNKQATIYSQLHQNIQDKFNEAGVEIMSPHYGAIRDGNQTAIPRDYLPQDYISPPFKINKDPHS